MAFKYFNVKNGLTAGNINLNASNATVETGNLIVSGESNLGNVANVHITGGANGQALVTDGAGVLSFQSISTTDNVAPMPYNIPVGESYIVNNDFQGLFAYPITIDGELEVDGILIDVSSYVNAPNNQILFTSANYATANAGFTFDPITGNLATPGNMTAARYIGDGGLLSNITPGSAITNGTSNIRIPNANGHVFVTVGGIGNIIVATSYAVDIDGTLNVAGMLTAFGNANVGNLTTGGVVAATGNVTGGNLVTGGGVAATGNVSAGNVYANTGTIGAQTLKGEGGNIGNVQGANVAGTVANATYATSAGSATSATTAGTVTTNAQSNITSVGVLTGLVMAGNITPNVSNTYNLGNTDNRWNNLFLSGNTIYLGNASIGSDGNNVTITNPDGGQLVIAGNGTASSNTIYNGTSDVSIPTANGNVNVVAAGNTTLVVTGTGVNVAGTVNATGNANVGNIGATNGVFTNVSGNGSSLSSITGANVTGAVSFATTANAVAAANVSGQVGNALVAGTVYTAAQPNITSVGTLTSLGITGNLSSGNANLGNAATANFFIGSGNNLSNIQGANVTGAVAFATTANAVAGANVSGTVSSATTAGTVTTAAQPNITSVGTLTSLGVSGNITAANITANTGVFTGNGSGLSAITGANVTGAVAFATTANSVAGANVSGTVNAATTAGTVTTAAQPNITSVGALTGLGVNGNITAANITSNTGVFTGNGSGLSAIAGANVTGAVAFATTANSVAGANVSGTVSAATTAGTVTTAAQPNITSVGTLTSLNTSGNAVIGGDLTVNGNLVYVNVETLAVEDPIIQLQSGPNGAAPAANSGKDVGTGLNYYDTQARVAFMGWDVSNAEFGMASQASITSEVVTFTAYGNLRVGNIIGNGQALTALTGANVTGAVPFATTANAVAGANVSGTVSSATNAGTVTTAAQPNITSVGTLTSLGVTGNITAANITANTGIFTGNGSGLSAVTGANVTGAVAFATTANSVAGANVSGAVAFATTANAVAGANVSGTVANATFATSAATAGTVTTAAQPNITSVGTLASLNVNGAVTAVSFTANTGVFTGNGSGLSAITGGNVTGTVPSATTAATAGTVTTAAQPNITSVGTLASLGVNGAVTAISFTANSGVFTGNGSGLSAITGANVTGAVANATFATTAGSATTAGTVTTAAQPNITSLGTLTTLGVNNTITAVAFTANTGVFTGNGNGLSSIVGANVTGAVAFATTANAVAGANVSGTVASATSATNASALLQNTSSATTVYPTFSASSANGNSAAVFNTSISANLANASITATTFVGTLSGAATSATTAGTVTTNAQPNITSVGTLTTLGVNNTITAVAFTANTGVFTGNGSGLSAIAGANVTGTVANATFATSAGTAGTVTTAAQPNITSVGTLTGLGVNGTITGVNITANTGVFTGNANGLSSIVGANVTGAVSFATTANAVAGANVSGAVAFATTANAVAGANVSGTVASATTAGTVTTNAQPNITSVGTLTSATVTGNVAAGNLTTTGVLSVTGTGVSSIAGNLDMTGNTIINLATPTNATDAATKQYVDDVAQGLHTHDSCNAATNTTLATISGGTVTYNNGTAGVGANLTTTGTFTTIDGVTLSNGMRILVKNEANAAHNGIYDRTSTTVLTRSTDFDTPTEMAGGDFTFVTAGTLYDNTGWVMPDPVTTVGTTNVVWVQFSGAGTYTAGTGLTLTGSEFSVNASQTQVTSVGTLTGLAVNGNITAANITANTGVFTGNGSALTALNASNVSTGTLAQARLANASVTLGNTALTLGGTVTTVAGLTSVTSTTFVGALTGAATTAGTVTTAAQPNITSVGTLTGLGVSGTITAPAFTANTGVFTGNGSGLSAIAGANVTGAVAFATTANAVAGANVSGAVAFATTANAVAGANVSGTVASATSATNASALLQNTSAATSVFPTFSTSSANGNSSAVVSTGISANLANNSITATTFVGALSGAATTAGSATTAGTVTTAAQPNITSVGTLTSLGVNGTVTAVAFTANTGVFTGNGNGLSSIVGANVSGTVASATAATNASALLQNTSTATTVYPTFSTSSANGNSSAVINTGISANLANASITATTFVGALSGAATSATTAGTVTTAAQPNITSVGTLTSLGVTGTTTSGNFATAGNITASFLVSNVATGTAPLTVTSTTRVANLNVAYANVADNINVAAGTGNNFLIFANAATGNVAELTSTGLTANLSNNSITATTFVGALSGTATSATTAGTVTTAAQPNITSVGTLTGLTIGNATANAVFGNGTITLNSGLITGNGAGLSQLAGANVTGAVAFATTANAVAGANVTGTVASATAATNASALLQNTSSATTVYPTFSTSSANGNSSAVINTGISANLANAAITATTFVGALSGAATSATTAGTVTTAAQPNITSVGTLTSLAVTGNATAANFVGNLANGNSSISIPAANGNINLNAAGAATPELVITSTGVNVNGTLNATGAGQIGGDLLVSGNAVVTGNLAINGNLTYLNVETIAVEDPIIQLQTGANGAAPTANSGKDVGTALNYYDTAARIAFMGWDTSNAEFGMASAASITAEVVTFSTYGNLRVGNIIGNGQALTGIAGGNVTGQVANATVAGTVYTAAQPNITSVGTLTSLSTLGTVAIYSIANNNFSTGFNVYKRGNTSDANGLVVSGAELGYHGFYGYDGTAYARGAYAIAQTTENWTATAHGTKYAIATTPNGSITSADRLTVEQNGNVTIVGNASVGSAFSVTGNANVGNIGTATAIITTGNITTVNTGLVQSGNSNIAITANGNITLSATGTPNELTITSTGVNVAGTLNANGNANVGNLGTAQVLATANVTAPRLISNVATGTAPLSVQSTTVVANLNADLLDGFNTATANTASTIAVRDANGNVSANFFIGNGSQLTGIITSVSNVSNGNSNLNIPAANGNVNLSVAGNANVAVFTGTGVNVAGTLNATGNVSFTGANVSLGSNANVKITGGSSGQILSTDGTGNLSWTSSTPGGAFVFTQATPATTWTINHNLGVRYVNIQVIDSTGNSFTGRYNYPTIAFSNTTHCVVTFDSAQAGYAAVTSGGGAQGPAGSVGGANTNIQFNDNSVSNGSANFTFDKTTNLLTVTGNITTSGQLRSTVATGTAPLVVSSTTQVANLNAATAGTVTTAAQPNITSTGTLTSLTVSGNVSIADRIIHTDDTDTAIRFPAVDTFTVETAGAERVRVTSVGYLEAVYSDKVVALGNSGTATSIDLRQGTVFTATLTGNCTFTLTNPNANASRGSSFTLILTNDVTAGRTIAWAGGSFKFPGGAAAVTRTTTANAVDVWVFFTPDGGVTWYGNISMKDVKA